MTSPNLESLVKINQLKIEPPDRREFVGLVDSARARLNDAHNESLALESRFDLAYNASHALALAALRWHGYRSDSRYIVFQCLAHTLGLGPEIWKVLSHCHHLRNRGEYEGLLEVNERLVTDLIQATGVVLVKIDGLEPS